MKNSEEKIIHTVCSPCGRKYGNGKIDKKGSIGFWMGTCDICGKENVPCASAPHDYGIYSNEEMRKRDKLQDAI